MGSNSSISSSEPTRLDIGVRDVLCRLAWFFLPLVVAYLALLGVGLVSGEVLPARLAARIQADAGQPVLYLPASSDRNFVFKLEGALKRRPDILALGQSRSNQWRSAMFGRTFYNASQAVYSIEDEISFIQSLGAYSPDILIIPVDFYQFNPKWEAIYKNASKFDINLANPTEWMHAALTMADLIRRDPFGTIRIQRDPIYGAPAIGLSAGLRGNGFRSDGSYQYGTEIQGNFSQGATVERALNRVNLGIAPFMYSDRLDPSLMIKFTELVRMAQARGTKVIGVSMPYQPGVVEGLDGSPRHAAWRQFRAPLFHEWIKSLGVTYFDFTDISSFEGMSNEFVDAFHPSEPAYVRMLLKILETADGASLFPDIDKSKLEGRLATASTLEVYRNDF